MGFFDIESGPAASFKIPGDSVTGVIQRPYNVRQATEYLTDKPKVDDQGRPVNMAVIELQTDMRDPNINGDNGTRVLYVEKFGQKKAISEAVKQAGAEDLEPGGRLTVQYVRSDPSTKGSPLMIWAAQYVKPSNGMFGANGGNLAPESTPPVATQYPLNVPQQPAPQPVDIVAQARSVQAQAAAQHVATAPVPAQATVAPTGGSDIDRIRSLAATGFSKGQIHEAMPQYSVDMIAALLNV